MHDLVGGHIQTTLPPSLSIHHLFLAPVNYLVSKTVKPI